ncbi:hypothetical protein EON80_15250 [bacterium]|nr:MAG: hypothetical protein EON80_15250 [bacterium]
MLVTYPLLVMREKGLTPQKIVRVMNRGRRLTPKQIENRARVVTRVLRHGNCGELYARQLARILEIDATYLELPRQCWPQAWRNQGAAETPETTHAASVGRGCNPSRRTTPPNPRRINVLRLIP